MRKEYTERKNHSSFSAPGLAGYLTFHRGPLGLFLLFILIYAAIFYLYRLPVEAVLYGALLYAAAAAPLLIARHRRGRRKKEVLRRIQRELTDEPEQFDFRQVFDPCGSCPEAETALEQQYQELLFLLSRDRERLSDRIAKERGEMVDYYTMWVHQIKTPIAAMRLLLQSRSEPGGGELEEQLFKIEEYVNMVLQYLRLDEKSDLLLRPCELDGLIRQAVRRYAGMFIRNKLKLTYGGVDCTVLTDEKWFVFVLEQLLSNAVKYTKTGGVSIYLEDGPEQALVIEDTGIGIAPEDQPRIFEKGFTGYNGRQDKKSTGIGLYLCRLALNRLSHTISVESEPGKGTKMRIGLQRTELSVE